MKWLFYLPSPFGEKVRDLDYPERHPMGGSEATALRVIQSLRAQGHTAEIAVEADECLSYRDWDVWVVLRDWRVFAKEHRPAKAAYLWSQDDVDQPFLEPLGQSEIAEFTFSQCQRVIVPSQYSARRWNEAFAVPPDKLEVIANAVPLKKFPLVTDAHLAERPPHVYYASTPQRGLKELVQAWPGIVEKVPEAKLTVASSMQTYHGRDNAELQSLFEQVRALPNTTYAGALNQAGLRELALDCRALAYPCTFAETGCVAAMEAMAAGCVVVGTALGALPETARLNPLVAPYDDWLDVWKGECIRVLSDADYRLTYARRNLQTARWMDVEVVVQRWIQTARADIAL